MTRETSYLIDSEGNGTSTTEISCHLHIVGGRP